MRLVIPMVISLCLAACWTTNSKSAAKSAASSSDSNPVVIALRVTGEGEATTREASPMQPTLVVDAEPGKPFVGSTKLGDHTIAVSGSLQELRDGRYRISIQYNRQGPAYHQAVKTTLELSRGEDFALGGLPAEPKEHHVALLLQ